VTSIPPTITAIREHPRRRGRFVVEIDGQSVAVVGVDTVAELGLSVGLTVAPATLRSLDVANRRTALLDRALNLLAVRARSTRDLRLRLRRLNAADVDTDWVLRKLETLGYLDDAAYARQFARSRMVGGGRSKRRVQDELYRRGVSREVATEAIDELVADVEIDEYGAALGAARKRLPSLGKLDAPTRRRRLYAFLARRGYESEIVSRVVRDVLRSSETES
jgi:regulatory protein